MGLWSWLKKGPRWSFVIDTDSYAGNFERQLSAYVIGRCDDFGEGMHRVRPYINLYLTECGRLLEDLVDYRVNDPGDDAICRAPMDCAPTPGTREFNSVALFMSHKPSKKQLALLVQRAVKFPSVVVPDLPSVWNPCKEIRIRSCRLVEEHTRIVSHALKLKP